MSPTGIDLAEATFTDVGETAGHGYVALLPVGSTEAHGPHLPLSTDVIIARGMAFRAAELLAERGVRTVRLPPLAYGVTDCAAEFPGTITISASVLETLIVDIARSLECQGARGLVLCNAHLEPAHREALQRTVETARGAGLRVVFPDCVRKPHALALGEEFRSGACHAGDYETSLVLALAPALVRTEVQKSLPDHPVSIGKALAEGKKTFKEAGGERAYFGFPARASIENGRRWLEALARMIADEAQVLG